MTDPDNQHASVSAFYEYKALLEAPPLTSDAFLAGWKAALLRMAGDFDEYDPAHKHLLKCADATPDQLP